MRGALTAGVLLLALATGRAGAATPTASDGCRQLRDDAGLQPLADCSLGADGRLQLSKAALAGLDYDAAGNATVHAGDGFHYVKRDGRQLAVVAWDNGADPYQQALVRTRVDGRIGFADPAFQPAFAARFDFAWPFQDGRALVCDGCRPTAPDADGHRGLAGGRWFHIDRHGQAVDGPRDRAF